MFFLICLKGFVLVQPFATQEMNYENYRSESPVGEHCKPHAKHSEVEGEGEKPAASYTENPHRNNGYCHWVADINKEQMTTEKQKRTSRSLRAPRVSSALILVVTEQVSLIIPILYEVTEVHRS